MKIYVLWCFPCKFWEFQFFCEIRTKYSSEFNKFDKSANLIYISTLGEKLANVIPVHKKLSSKKRNLAGHIHEADRMLTAYPCFTYKVLFEAFRITKFKIDSRVTHFL